MSFEQVCQTLLRSKEPSVRWKLRVHVFEEDPRSTRIRDLEQEIRRSPRVKTLLAHRDSRGRLRPVGNPYSKWQGAHWVLATLADIGYPRADRSLLAMGDQVLDRWLADVYYREFDAKTEADAYRGVGVPRMRGRYRRCASQQGNALYFLTKLGLADGRVDAVVEGLLLWQWPDGGWNCDKHPSADTYSFWESRHAMLGLALCAERTKETRARDAATRAAEVFLSRQLFLERRSGRVMNSEFLRLHYPLYYGYDILGGLKAMAEIGRLDDPRCEKALNLLEEKQLPGGGGAAERRLYAVSSSVKTRGEDVDWGGARPRGKNEWETAEALQVLPAAGRMGDRGKRSARVWHAG